MRTRALLLVVLTIAIGALVVGYVLLMERTRLPERRLVGLFPAGAREVVLLTHADESATRWVELVTAEGRTRWQTEITPLEVLMKDRTLGGAVAGDQIVLVADDLPSQRYVVLALSRSDGQVSWMRKLERSDAAFTWEPTTTVIPDGERIYLVHKGVERTAGMNRHRELRVDALTVADGALLWTFVDPEYLQLETTVHRLADDRLLVAKRRGPSQVLAGATGDVVASLPKNTAHDGPGLDFRCGFPGGAVAGLHGGWAILDADGGSIEGADEVTWDFREGLLERWLCGLRGDHVIVQATRFGEREYALLALDRGSADVVWRIDLEETCLGPVEHPGGLLPRFLPLITNCTSKEKNAVELVVVDLDRGKVVERTPFGYSFSLNAPRCGRASGPGSGGGPKTLCWAWIQTAASSGMRSDSIARCRQHWTPSPESCFWAATSSLPICPGSRSTWPKVESSTAGTPPPSKQPAKRSKMTRWTKNESRHSATTRSRFSGGSSRSTSSRTTGGSSSGYGHRANRRRPSRR